MSTIRIKITKIISSLSLSPLKAAKLENFSHFDLLNLEMNGKISLNIRLIDVYAVIIENEEMLKKIPNTLVDYFPKMTALYINNCGIEEIARKDLENFIFLREISLTNLKIQEISEDLFADLINLEVISLNNNEIKFIAKYAFKWSRKLSLVNLLDNPTVNILYASENHENFYDKNQYSKFDLFIDEIDKIYRSKPKIKNFQDETAAKSNTKGLNNKELQIGIKQPQLERTTGQLPQNLSKAIYKIIKLDDFKDFTIKIGENEFKVHKLILAARSSTLAEMIKNNPDANELILEDIQVEVFKIILDYIYEDKMPEIIDENSEKVFVAAEKLKLEPLKDIVGRILCEIVDTQNCFEIFKLAFKNNHEELKSKSFNEFKKLLNDFEIKDELINDFEKVKKFYEAKKNYDEKLKKMNEDLQRMLKE